MIRRLYAIFIACFSTLVATTFLYTPSRAPAQSAPALAAKFLYQKLVAARRYECPPPLMTLWVITTVSHTHAGRCSLVSLPHARHHWLRLVKLSHAVKYFQRCRGPARLPPAFPSLPPPCRAPSSFRRLSAISFSYARVSLVNAH